MRARALLLGIALVFVTGSQALAQDDDEEEEEYADATLVGWYVGASGSYAVENFSGGISSSNGYGGGLTVGHRASDMLSFEVEMNWLDGFDVPGSRSVPGQQKSEVEIMTSTLNFRVHFPIEENSWEPYMTYGVGFMDVETGDTPNQALGRFKHTALMVKAGLGVSYQYSDALSLYGAGSYALPLGNIKEYDHAAFTVGFIYKFVGDDDDY